MTTPLTQEENELAIDLLKKLGDEFRKERIGPIDQQLRIIEVCCSELKDATESLDRANPEPCRNRLRAALCVLKSFALEAFPWPGQMGPMFIQRD